MFDGLLQIIFSDLLDDADLGATAAEQLKKTTLIFDSFVVLKTTAFGRTTIFFGFLANISYFQQDTLTVIKITPKLIVL